jgi:hypothetical protein
MADQYIGGLRVTEDGALYVDGGYNPASVAITGGTINGATIGGTTPAAITGTTITATTQFVAPAGSTADPSYRFTDPNTGFYEVAANNISVDINGTEHTRFATGNITTNAVLGLGATAGAPDVFFGRSGANAAVFGGANGAAGSVTSRTEINKAVSAIANNTATAVFTVTVPNAAHSASIRVRLTGSLGAGGAIGANESTQDATYNINITRTAGVATVATIGAVVGQPAAASVVGANNAATTGTLSAISGAVGATQTFTINVTIARSGGSSDNHTCLAYAELMNANATGITIA